MSQYRYGWQPDLPDIRDRYVRGMSASGLPSSVDLRDQMPPVYDQGSLGSCSSQSIAAAIEYERIKQGLTDFVPSRLFIYYNERVMEGDPSVDSGAAIRDGIKSVASQGACSEADWSYDISKFAVAPPQNCYDDAKHDLVTSYARVGQDINAMRSVLAQRQPFVFGITVYDSFESQAVAATGIVPMPGSSENMLGGHAILAVGYDDAKRVFVFRNSWGSGWGNAGYGTIPYAYLANSDLASDFWTISAVSGVSLSADVHGMLKSLDARFGKLFQAAK